MTNPNEDTADEWLANSRGAEVARDYMNNVAYTRRIEVELDVRVPISVPDDLSDDEAKNAALWMIQNGGHFELNDSTVHDAPDYPRDL